MAPELRSSSELIFDYTRGSNKRSTNLMYASWSLLVIFLSSTVKTYATLYLENSRMKPTTCWLSLGCRLRASMVVDSPPASLMNQS